MYCLISGIFTCIVDIRNILNGVILPGKPTGECFVELISAPDMRKALLQHHRYLGRRYLEVERCSEEAMEQTLKTHGEEVRNSHPIVRLRGLLFNLKPHVMWITTYMV